MEVAEARRVLLAQRSEGSVSSTFGARGLIRHREDGCLKLRVPHGSSDAILINISGGLAGGDQIAAKLVALKGVTISVTSQAAERVYGTLGPPAKIAHEFTVEEQASLYWLPQETILFDGSSLKREMNVRLAEGATFLATESIVLGRTAMGEQVNKIHLQDSWNIWRGGKLIHAERLSLGAAIPQSAATLGSAKAFATVLLVSDRTEQLLPTIQTALGDNSGVSSWNGKLLARLVAHDGFQLRKQLKTVLTACLGGRPLPQTWMM